MKLRLILFLCMLCSSIRLHASEEESSVVATPVTASTLLEQLSESATETLKPTESVTESSAEQTEPVVAQKPSQTSTVHSFVRFVRILIAILSNPTFQTNARMIEKLIASMLQTSYQIMQSNQSTSPARTRSPEQDDLFLQLVLEEIDQQSLSQVRTQPKKPSQVDQDTQEIIGHFAGVVNNFFRIVADPENPETVPASVIGMIAGMVNIGAVAMKKSGPPAPGADHKVFKQYAQDLDSGIKEQMYQFILKRRDELGIVINQAA